MFYEKKAARFERFFLWFKNVANFGEFWGSLANFGEVGAVANAEMKRILVCDSWVGWVVLPG